MKKDKILLFSNFDFPNSSANAIRVLNIAKLLKRIGYYPIVYGVTYENKPNYGEFEGINYKLIQIEKNTGLYSIKRNRSLKEKIQNELRLYNIESMKAILLSNIYFDCSNVFMKYSNKNNIPLIVNSVEWYDINNDQFKGIYGPIKFIKNRIALIYIHKKMNNIIAISTLLDNYYSSRKCNTITIPTIIDPKHYNISEKQHNNKKIKLCYAGSPAKKDLVINYIYALLQMNKKQQKQFEINIYGVGDDFLKNKGLTNEQIYHLNDIVFFHGRIPYEEVKDKIAESDYTLLARPQKRYANAGFPTKIGESLACGTPVITNITSDLDKYLIDMKNSIICKDETIGSCKDALLKAIIINKNDYNNMRKCAKETANKFFSYTKYCERMQKYLEKISIRKKNSD